MVTAPEKFGLEMTEPEKVVEEFRQALIQSLRHEREKMREVADREAKLILTKAYQESANLTSQAQEQSKQLSAAKVRVESEVELLLSQAQQRAEQIIYNAEEISRKDAKERTRREIESIIRSAKEETAKQTTKILQTAKDESNSIIMEAKKEAVMAAHQITEKAEKESQEITRETRDLRQKAANELSEAQNKAAAAIEQIMANARKSAVEKAEKEASEIMVQTKLRAQKEREYLLANAMTEAKTAAEVEATQIILKAKQEAEVIINAAKNKFRNQIDESSRLMQEIQQRMQQVIGVTEIDQIKTGIDNTKKEKSTSETPTVSATTSAPASIPVFTPVVTPVKPTAVKDITEVKGKNESVTYDEERQTYRGNLRIDVAPPVDSEQMAELEKRLAEITYLRVITKGGSADGSAWIEIRTEKPLPLLDILRKIPSVKDVVGCKSYIIVALKSRQLV